MFRFRDSGPGDGQRTRFSGFSESQKRRLRQVPLRSEFIDGHEYQLVSNNLKVIYRAANKENLFLLAVLFLIL